MTEFGLPRELPDGLRLRWATPADAEKVAAFNVQMHSDNPDELETWLGHWTHDLMCGHHPTTQASDFTVVEDIATGEIVSSVCLISQRWSYDGVEFDVGRPELVATHPDYRRRGLVRLQMDAIHAKSEARGELVQAITGIPWYYRMFGYEMGLDLGGGRVYALPQNTPKAGSEGEEAVYAIRKATLADLPLLQMLYGRHCAESRVMAVRDAALWEYEMTTAHPETIYRRRPYLITHLESETAVAYVDYFQHRDYFGVREMAAIPGHSLRAVALFLLKHLQEEALAMPADETPRVDRVVFQMGAAHPVYRALVREVRYSYPPYAWYIRVANMAAFLRLLTPVLENRLANSVMAGYNGTARLNFYTSQLKIEFTAGKISDIGPYEAKAVADGSAQFPDLTFIQLLMGFRSLEDLNKARVDCYVNNEMAVLLPILFPPQHSWVSGVG